MKPLYVADSSQHTRLLADQAFSRAAGAPLVSGNHVDILKDAAENYPAWEHAIRAAEHFILFENYIIANDKIGQHFVSLLTEKAKHGVQVYVIYDWIGALGKASNALWKSLVDAGGEVRCFNPPRIDSPFSWTSRDHRKTLVVDGKIGFVSGLCVADSWIGDGKKNSPWRDTGLRITGPAVIDIAQAFAQIWSVCGDPLTLNLTLDHPQISDANDVTLRVIATTPNSSSLYRLDHLISAVARKTLWLTDPYYVASPSYMHALCAAAQDGVDVRLLVPSSTDLPALSPLSRSGFRPLLESGVRVFEWNGSMIHAKTAVADGRWARVGSSNLNIASWLNNYELDVAIEDQLIAEQMERIYESDLSQATEIVLTTQSKVSLRHPRQQKNNSKLIANNGAARTTATAVRLSNTVAMAIRQKRVLAPTEATLTLIVGCVLMLFGVVCLIWPKIIAVPLALLSLWLAFCCIAKAINMLKEHRSRLAFAIKRLRKRRKTTTLSSDQSDNGKDS